MLSVNGSYSRVLSFLGLPRAAVSCCYFAVLGCYLILMRKCVLHEVGYEVHYEVVFFPYQIAAGLRENGRRALWSYYCLWQCPEQQQHWDLEKEFVLFSVLLFLRYCKVKFHSSSAFLTVYQTLSLFLHPETVWDASLSPALKSEVYSTYRSRHGTVFRRF